MSDSLEHIVIVILAAGSSSRMGEPKQLLPYNHTTLLGNAIEQAKKSDAQKIVLVLGANAHLIEEAHKSAEVEFVINPDWENGMGSSIAVAVNHLMNNTGEVNGILFMLADQPLVDYEHLNKLIAKFKSVPESIIASEYEKRAGVPAIFSQSYFSQLSRLGARAGAQTIIELNMKEVATVNLGEKSIDIDTKEEYRNLLENKL
ncbi:MAG: 4-diphosphocytidyl-2C-methyl-D-erythritol synthase [Pseudozobellia sp.]|nr:4-diphosphocytidyl-2C-methyl-D-erythritol synthase [Pseudozobellia sp.]|tara:strand:+ start:477 stop:1085 length:609 start_codon:yes stop_codon:yes gene_type:complete